MGDNGYIFWDVHQSASIHDRSAQNGSFLSLILTGPTAEVSTHTHTIIHHHTNSVLTMW